MLFLRHLIYLHKMDQIRSSLFWPHSTKTVPEFNCIPRPFTKNNQIKAHKIDKRNNMFTL